MFNHCQPSVGCHIGEQCGPGGNRLYTQLQHQRINSDQTNQHAQLYDAAPDAYKCVVLSAKFGTRREGTNNELTIEFEVSGDSSAGALSKPLNAKLLTPYREFPPVHFRQKSWFRGKLHKEVRRDGVFFSDGKGNTNKYGNNNYDSTENYDTENSDEDNDDSTKPEIFREVFKGTIIFRIAEEIVALSNDKNLLRNNNLNGFYFFEYGAGWTVLCLDGFLNTGRCRGNDSGVQSRWESFTETVGGFFSSAIGFNGSSAVNHHDSSTNQSHMQTTSYATNEEIFYQRNDYAREGGSGVAVGAAVGAGTFHNNYSTNIGKLNTGNYNNYNQSNNDKVDDNSPSNLQINDSFRQSTSQSSSSMNINPGFNPGLGGVISYPSAINDDAPYGVTNQQQSFKIEDRVVLDQGLSDLTREDHSSHNNLQSNDLVTHKSSPIGTIIFNDSVLNNLDSRTPPAAANFGNNYTNNTTLLQIIPNSLGFVEKPDGSREIGMISIDPDVGLLGNSVGVKTAMSREIKARRETSKKKHDDDRNDANAISVVVQHHPWKPSKRQQKERLKKANNHRTPGSEINHQNSNSPAADRNIYLLNADNKGTGQNILENDSEGDSESVDMSADGDSVIVTPPEYHRKTESRSSNHVITGGLDMGGDNHVVTGRSDAIVAAVNQPRPTTTNNELHRLSLNSTNTIWSDGTPSGQKMTINASTGLMPAATIQHRSINTTAVNLNTTNTNISSNTVSSSSQNRTGLSINNTSSSRANSVGRAEAKGPKLKDDEHPIPGGGTIQILEVSRDRDDELRVIACLNNCELDELTLSLSCTLYVYIGFPVSVSNATANANTSSSPIRQSSGDVGAVDTTGENDLHNDPLNPLPDPRHLANERLNKNNSRDTTTTVDVSNLSHPTITDADIAFQDPASVSAAISLSQRPHIVIPLRSMREHRLSRDMRMVHFMFCETDRRSGEQNNYNNQNNFPHPRNTSVNMRNFGLGDIQMIGGVAGGGRHSGGENPGGGFWLGQEVNHVTGGSGHYTGGSGNTGNNTSTEIVGNNYDSEADAYHLYNNSIENLFMNEPIENFYLTFEGTQVNMMRKPLQVCLQPFWVNNVVIPRRSPVLASNTVMLASMHQQRIGFCLGFCVGLIDEFFAIGNSLEFICILEQ